MQKRGNIWTSKSSTIAISKLLLGFFELVLVIAVYLALVAQLSGIKSDMTFEELYISRDLAFLIDTIYAAPGTVNYEYSIDKPILNIFIFDFKDQNVNINWEGVTQNYPSSENKKIPLNNIVVRNPDSIVFEKNDEKMTIEGK